MLARLPPGPVLLLGAPDPDEVPVTLADADRVFTLTELAPALTASDAPERENTHTHTDRERERE